MKKALITGITGQDGSYLAEFLLEKGYEVYGLVRRISSHQFTNINHIQDKLHICYGDLENEHHVCSLLDRIRPDEVYNLAAQSDVGISFDTPEYTGNVSGLGACRLLAAVKDFAKNARYYQASTSELFGQAPPPQNEDSCMMPASPYAAAKLYAHHMTRIYRQAYGLYACCGILFNHESPRRGPNFVTRKIAMAVGEIKRGEREKLTLGNLEAKRDWGYAPDYVRAMWMMLQQDSPDDYVIGTGEIHSVKEFAQEAFACVGLDWKDYVETDARFLRPIEAHHLCAEPTKARARLGWKPTVTFKGLVKIMVDSELKRQAR
ncbi:MAG: GDP-mannose 4,6-dehydratase [Dehalococcoidia bacterium]|nr:GDP-mannose 4,6-dehydratase [Dehalococcoidia bacterium]